ncbi:hypothetical protein LIER_36711 [Lithospermum erythrorhizon]|uniref:Uncharacterized protein n=1 Tax=Lithospermum erythrorhizon TaxID=34254 RepID=A0AAV3PAW4_LITER
MSGNQKLARICYQASVPLANPGGVDKESRHRRKNKLIREFTDLFAWGTKDMPGVDPTLALHMLHVDPMLVPVKQRKRIFNDEKNLAIREEVANVLKADAIHELQFPSWIANVVLVKKPKNKWRMCTNFTNLNKACLKDFYLLPCLGRLVDGMRGMKSFISWAPQEDII